jgi:hypothetical protein
VILSAMQQETPRPSHGSTFHLCRAVSFYVPSNSLPAAAYMTNPSLVTCSVTALHNGY